MANSTPNTLQSQLDAQRASSPANLSEVADAMVQARVADGMLSRTLKVGEQIPDFTLPDALGRPVSVAEALAKGPVVLTFYRGEWCPYCNLQLHAYQAIMPEITEMGATLIAISPQTPDHSLSMAEKHALSFVVLSDVGNVVARQFGVVYGYDDASRQFFAGRGLDLARFNGDATWEVPLAATFIVSPDGVIRMAFVDPDYRRRLEPADLLDSLRAVTKAVR